MPIIQDQTVVNQPHNTSGNGGRKLVRLDNGVLIAVVKNSTNYYLYKSVDNGTTWTQLYTNNLSSVQDISIITNGNLVYFVMTYGNSSVLCYVFDESGMKSEMGGMIDTVQTAMGNISLTINEQGTELHATWASKNSTYPNSFNIRYAKGIINADGSVTWGAVEQVTTINSTSININNPTLTLNQNGKPVIITDRNMSNNHGILVFVKLMSDWSSSATASIVEGSAHVQTNPQGIFIPQEIAIKNPKFAGATQGVNAVVWQGKDSSYPNADNIRFSYSLDGGIVWNTEKLTTMIGAQYARYPTLTANSEGKVFVVYQHLAAEVWTLENMGTWSVRDTMSSDISSTSYPTSLYEPYFDFDLPLYIYRGARTIGFYGSWIVTKMSVPEGSIGTAADKNNVLPYSITTDGSMSEIVEKINGVEVGRKTATSGQELAVSLTQAQWDDVRFGKYDKSSLEFLANNNSNDWELGNYSTNGTLVASSTLIRFKNNTLPTTYGLTYKVNIHPSYRLRVLTWDESSSSISYINEGYFVDGDTLTIKNKNAKIMRVLINRVDGTALLLSEITIANLIITYPSYPQNTLTIEMGNNKWGYTFDKRLAENSDIISIVKAKKDTNEVFLPAVKSDLISVLRSKGVNVSDGADWETIEQAIEGIPLGKNWAKGTISVSNSGTVNSPSLTFNPKTVLIVSKQSGASERAIRSKELLLPNGDELTIQTTQCNVNSITGNIFNIQQRTGITPITMEYLAIE